MDTAEICKAKMVSKSHDAEVSWGDELQQLVQTFPKDKSWAGNNLYFYQGFWCPSLVLKSFISFQNHFQAFDSDVIVATFPKSGTTWLKALTFSTLYRNKITKDDNPLFSFGPHELVRIPTVSLSAYVGFRNPMDMFISLWHFTDKLREEKLDSVSLDQAFDKFCNGVCEFGPFFDHVLGYWKASQENPNKILFLKYEALKEDMNSHLKKLAMFLGVPFTEEEEKEGVVEEIAKVCSFKSLKELEVNKKGLHISGIPHTDFFRKAKVGDWSNYLTPAMVERMEKLVQERLDISGFTFKFS
ncbi:sulfotransferase 2A, ARABIDOPSIS THALIANA SULFOTRANSFERASE 2A [Hibiscus trionum]|uniref:Sulfotransferase n=1 Tax=Hibiscus trionum TaxID=183268 RepID=A0A9W7LHE6_HIBTR|nr:sulfotransferase 2A, ARABIDOPSIS THALIANA SULFOTRANSFERASE 2A [Hibiscus trionum]